MSDTNPFNIGYYPGDRFIKQPNYYIPRPEFYVNPDFSGFNEFSNQLFSWDPFSWTSKNLTNDFWKSFTADVKPATISTQELSAYGSEAMQDSPAAFGTGINLKDLVTKPGDTIVKFVTDSAKNIFDWTDIENQKVVEAWQYILSDPKTVSQKIEEERYNPKSIYYNMTDSQIQALPGLSDFASPSSNVQSFASTQTDFILNASRTGFQRPGPNQRFSNPLSMDGLSMINKTGDSFNPYTDVRAKVIEFERNSSTAPFRDGKFDDMVKSMGGAIRADLENQIWHTESKRTVVYDGRNETYEAALTQHQKGIYGNNYINNWSSLDKAGQVNQTYAVKALAEYDFREKNGYSKKYFEDLANNGILNTPQGRSAADHAEMMAKKLESLQARLDIADIIGDTSKNLFNFDKSLNKYLLTGDGDMLIKELRAQKVLIYDATGNLTSVGLANNARANLTKLNGVSGVNGNNVDIKGLAARIDPANKKNLNGVINNVDSRLRDIEKLEGDIKRLATASGAERAALVVKIQGQVSTISNGGFTGRGLTRGNNMLGKSMHGQLLGHIRDEIKADVDGLYGKTSVGGSIIRAILPRLENEREWAWVEEFSNAMQSGGLNKYAWMKIQSAIGPYAPNVWMTRFMQRYHYFGFVISQDLVDENDFIKIGYGRFGFTLGGPGRPGRVFGNHFTVGAKAGDIYSAGNAYKNVIGRKFNLYGGKHLKFVTIADGLKPDALKKLLTMSDAEIQLLFFSGGDAAMSNLRLIGLWRKNGGKAPYKTKEEFEAFRNNLVTYRKWVLDNMARIGLTPADFKDPETMFEFFQLLRQRNVNPNTVSIINKYSGFVEKAWEKLNALQNRILQNKYGQFIVNKLFKWRGFIEKRIADSLKFITSKAINYLIQILGGAATAGIGAIVLKLIGPIIDFFVQKIVGGALSLLKAALTLNFQDLLDSFNKAFEKSIKLALTIGGIPILAILFISTALFNQASSGQMPTNPSVVGGGGYGDDGGAGGLPVPGGARNVCIEETVPASTCIYKDPINVLRTSYIRSHESGATGHGSNDYWDTMNTVMGAADCGFSIPGTNGFSPDGPTGSAASYCRFETDLKEYYGFAYDVQSTGDCQSVYLPNVVGAGSVTWTSGMVGSSGHYGDMVELNGTVAGQSAPSYKMWLIHVASGTVNRGVNMPAGQKIAETFDWGDNHHIHIEFFTRSGTSWAPQTPESFICP